MLFAMSAINWSEQWKTHAPNFKDGYAYVHLNDYGGPLCSFRLKPGPGFGDLSHPTTRLMLTLMPQFITNPVVDIGCGSGVLSLAARLCGAPQVYGIDIDPDALTHAQENAKLNRLDQIFFCKCLPILTSPLILMNMISSEQKKAWESRRELHSIKKTLIISGIPIEERDSFLKQLPKSYGSLHTEISFENWLGFLLIS